jgi:LYSR family transcriptional regulatory protein
MLKEMSYVYAVYKEKSFSRAAQKLFISQPALSAMVKKAEQEIGVLIFDRSTNPISLTTAGRYYINQAKEILRIQNEMKAYFRVAAEAEAGKLRIGGSSFFLSYVFPPIVNAFQRKNFEVNTAYFELRNTELVSKLLDDSIDFFIEVDDLQDEQIESIVLQQEHLIFAVPAAWSVNDLLDEFRLTAEDVHERRHLSDDVPAVSPSAFADEPFVLLREGNDSFLRAITICQNAGFTPQVAMTADQVLTSYYLAAEGHGIALVRDSILLYADVTEKLYFYKINDLAALRPIYFFFRRHAQLPPAAQAFLDYVRKNRPDC